MHFKILREGDFSRKEQWHQKIQRGDKLVVGLDDLNKNECSYKDSLTILSLS
jgi:hypothetical protein